MLWFHLHLISSALPRLLKNSRLMSKYTSLYKLPGIWITSWWRSNIILFFPCPHHFLHSGDLFHLCNNESSWRRARVCLNGTQKVVFKQRWRDTRECFFWRSERAGWQNRRQSMLLCATFSQAALPLCWGFFLFLAKNAWNKLCCAEAERDKSRHGETISQLATKTLIQRSAAV